MGPTKRTNKHACALSKELLKRTANAIEPYIQGFFNNVLILGKTSESEVSDFLYDLIYELYQVRACMHVWAFAKWHLVAGVRAYVRAYVRVILARGCVTREFLLVVFALRQRSLNFKGKDSEGSYRVTPLKPP